MKNINIKGFEHYLVNKDGNVYNTKSSRGMRTGKPAKLKSWANKNTGYHTVVLRNGIDKPNCQYVHRLVATAYLPNPLNLPEVNHKNFDKTNNSVDNLEWVTTKQNKWHSIQYGCRGKTSKITNDIDLLNDGINNWIENEDMDILCSIWNCSNTTAYRILKKNNIKCNNHCLPESLRVKIMADIKSHNSTKYGSSFLINLRKKYKVNITHHQFYKIKKETIGKKFIKKSL